MREEFSKVSDADRLLLPEPFGPATKVRVGTSSGGFSEDFTHDNAVAFSGLRGIQSHFEEPAVGPLQNILASHVDKDDGMTRGERLISGSAARFGGGSSKFVGQHASVDHTI